MTHRFSIDYYVDLEDGEDPQEVLESSVAAAKEIIALEQQYHGINKKVVVGGTWEEL